MSFFLYLCNCADINLGSHQCYEETQTLPPQKKETGDFEEIDGLVLIPDSISNGVDANGTMFYGLIDDNEQ